jgi:hypothetical protein
LFDGDLVLPDFLYGSPKFIVIRTEAGFEITDGVVDVEMFPDAFFGEDASTCDNPIPIGDDPQDQDIVGWQATNKLELIEQRTLELTNGCGSSRGVTRSKSFFLVGLNINFCIDYMATPEAVEQEFINLTRMKLEFLLEALEKAELAVIKRRDFKKLTKMAKNALKVFNKGNYQDSLNLQKNFLKFVERTEFDPDVAFNNFGNLRSRIENIIFMTEVKVIPFAP